MVVDWVPNRERRPAGRVSFAQTGRRSRPRQARTLLYSLSIQYHFRVYYETELLFEKFVFAQRLLLASGS